MDDDASHPTMILPEPGRRGSAAHAAHADDARRALPWFAGAQRDDASLSAAVQPRAAAQDMALHPGLRSGRLQDEGEIARGGMGSVHRLYDHTLRRRIAMKVLDPRLAIDPEHLQRFVDEARITGALDHPSIVSVHDLSIDDTGRASYTMRLVEGRTLTALIAQQSSRRDLERILQCMATVCDVLAYAHQRGVIHRDLKPDNIMVGEFGEVYLMDWGCALVRGARTLVDGAIDPEGTVVGTVRYMAPEQARGEIARIDARSDVFAVGAILYKALTGQPPYRGRTAEALDAAKRADFQALDERLDMAVKPPPMLTAIVKKAMAADPARRHRTAAELAEDLRDFLRGGNWFALHTFPAGTVIVREGEWADAAYIITAGRCEVRQRDTADPRRHRVLRVLQTDDVFGETAIFADVPRSASVVATEDVSAVALDRATLEQLATNTYLGKYIQALAARFLDVEGQLRQARSGAAPQP
jgi:eukaryotic-like serine/threonine-protein kinase